MDWVAPVTPELIGGELLVWWWVVTERFVLTGELLWFEGGYVKYVELSCAMEGASVCVIPSRLWKDLRHQHSVLGAKWTLGREGFAVR